MSVNINSQIKDHLTKMSGHGKEHQRELNFNNFVIRPERTAMWNIIDALKAELLSGTTTYYSFVPGVNFSSRSELKYATGETGVKYIFNIFKRTEFKKFFIPFGYDTTTYSIHFVLILKNTGGMKFEIKVYRKTDEFIYSSLIDYQSDLPDDEIEQKIQECFIKVLSKLTECRYSFFCN